VFLTKWFLKGQMWGLGMQLSVLVSVNHRTTKKKKKKKIKRPVVMVQTCNLSTQNIEAREFHI
jgi:hypothetical protein